MKCLALSWNNASARYLLSSCVYSSVCPSVTSLSSTKTAKVRIAQTTPHDSPGTPVLWCKISLRNCSHPKGAQNVGVVGKNCVFRPFKNSPAQTPYRWKFLSIRHRAIRWSASTTVRWRKNTRCRQQRWLSRKFVGHNMAHFSVACMRHGASCTRYAIFEPIATMRVQNYWSSRIKSGSCWKCSSGWHAICLRYLYNSRTTFQPKQSVARVSRR